jgi:hypothetical protein
VHILTGQTVGGAKGANAFPQCSLLALQSLSVGLAGSQLREEPRDQRRYRRVPLGGSYARPAISLVVHSNRDIFHIITLPQEACGVETFFVPAKRFVRSGWVRRWLYRRSYGPNTGERVDATMRPSRKALLPTYELPESEIAGHWMKIAIVVEQRCTVFDAPGPDQEVDCLADCNPAPAQKTVIAGARGHHRFRYLCAWAIFRVVCIGA